MLAIQAFEGKKAVPAYQGLDPDEAHLRPAPDARRAVGRIASSVGGHARYARAAALPPGNSTAAQALGAPQGQKYRLL